MKKPRKPKMPAMRNYAAMVVRDPNGPFRPKTIPNKREAKLPRNRKHKGRDHDI
jgi:hypothetical protein|tara:strand:- start:234 stop:395 length:162 start_codon:yes stop_codon:yes gene_type:complete